MLLNYNCLVKIRCMNNQLLRYTMKYIALVLFTTISLFAGDSLGGYDEYLRFIKEHAHLGELGNYKEGKIEIVLEKNTLKKIEEMQAKRYMKEGETFSEAHQHAKIGIVARDKYWIWVRDAVIFPSGATGTFDRIVKTSSLRENVNNSVAILPVTSEGKVMLNVLYRHAIRDWVIEIPRGGIEKGESALQAGKRELKEETGLLGKDFTLLGEMTPDSGTVASVVPCYFAKVNFKGPTSQDFSEAILGLIELSKETIKNGFEKGYVDISLENKKMRVMIRDSYLSYAILIAEQKKLI